MSLAYCSSRRSGVERLKQLRVRNFKAFEDFTVTLGDQAFLVGPNNAGKSTLISALRIAAGMIRLATQSRPNMTGRHHDTSYVAYGFSGERLGLVEENIRHEFRNEDTTLEVTFGSGARLTAVWPGEDGEALADDEADSPYFYLLDALGRQPHRPAEVRAAFPSIGIIPQLSPIERRERILDPAYVRQNQEGRLASRHFRNQLFQLKHYSDDEDWGAFEQHLRTWVPEVEMTDITTRPGEDQLVEVDVYFREPPFRVEKEVCWAGDGMQIWLQLLLHTHRLRDSDIVVVDEPDVYLHADLQRRLVRLLNAHDGQTVTATHSPEVLGEADQRSIVWVDKTRRRAVRGDRAPVDLADNIGSQFNLRLARALRAKTVLFVEGHDLKILSRLARAVGTTRIAREEGIAVLPLQGFSNWHNVQSFKWFVDAFLDGSVGVFVILDRDYMPTEACAQVVSALAEVNVVGHVWARKEIENYLLDPALLGRTAGIDATDATAILVEGTDELKAATMARMLDARQSLVRDTRHRVNLNEEVLDEVTTNWSDLDYRLTVSPGKDLISRFNAKVADRGGRTVSATRLASEARIHDVPLEVADTLRAIEAACL
jgi:predicted ATPase